MKISAKNILRLILMTVMLLVVCFAASSCFGLGLEYTLSPDGSYYCVSGIGEANKDLIVFIPDMYNGLPVREISENAFSGASDMMCVHIGNNVTHIASGAFTKCNSLQKVTFGWRVETIGASAFAGCGLTMIDFNAALKEIGDYAFQGNNMQGIYLPGGVRKIGKGAFQNCGDLTYAALNEGLESIGDEAFKDTALYEVWLPETLKSIGKEAFDKEIKSSWIGKAEFYQGAQYIGSRTNPYFALVSLTGLEQVKSIELHSGTRLIASLTWRNYPNVETIVIPEGVESLPDGMLSGSYYLHTVFIPSTLKNIDEELFSYGYPQNIYYTGSKERFDSFEIAEDCAWLKKVQYYSESLPDEAGIFWRYVDGKPKLWLEAAPDSDNLEYSLDYSGEFYSVAGFSDSSSEYVVIPAEHNGLPVKKIGSYAFSGEKYIRGVRMPDSIRRIGYNAFDGCESLTDVMFSSSLEEIEADAFYRAPISSVKLSPSVKYIGSSAFMGVKRIEISGDIESGIEKIFGGANPVYVTISENNPAYSSIDGDLYDKDKTTLLVASDREDRSTLRLPDSVTEISDTALRGTENIKTLIIGENVSTLTKEQLDGSEIKSLVINPEKTVCQLGSFGNRVIAYCYGTEKDAWEIKSLIKASKIYYYSEKNPYIPDSFWHYNEDGDVEIWSDGRGES